ncbi:ornithine carbamoyltransferase [Campylobacter ureolyticus]|jgi:ornithine carbamoyltransferase|uniref:Ornithine carbamoyltransferase n=1 Tax=Campylobacter ureolyticus TaxID=827 RepID=A0A9Q4PUB8_9BACT|nr:ornithine carbamoyltransferase [Campylobacter ureolyticus]MCZ6133152.1 ornithine carbamoyltransferase [Campylobacter ureolyticus]MCZ6159161.1 ornithine carbamoyltransferase [Campylobacter ureolyticus]MCZ6162821.1 ornithine carbamoyltransferase [Campylobacter ureolyticus]MCZ6164686.1 ornithine carbamoyltransferase [Campylobacter ureolyticus]
MKDFLTLNDFSKEQILEILEIAKNIKNEVKKGIFTPYLKNQTLAMVFEKNSTRTRISFEVGMYQLGGHALFLDSKITQLGRGEPIKDTARVISSMCDMAMLRVYKHADLKEFAKFAKIPVINGLSDLFHPVQLMADYLTMIELNAGKNIAYIGDSNNMCNSWLNLASIMGLNLSVAIPKNYKINDEVLKIAMNNAKISGAKITVTNDPKIAIKDVDVVATDTWFSMGDEVSKDQKVKDFKGFLIDEDLMSLAKKDAILLHCLPAYRGYEISDKVFEKHSKEIFLEAENRLHAQKGIMVWLNNACKNS